MSNTIIDLLKETQKQQEKNKKILGEAYNDNDLVTCWDDGSPVNPATFSQ